MAWIGSFVASIVVTLEVHMSLHVTLLCVVKFAALGAKLGKNRSMQVASLANSAVQFAATERCRGGANPPPPTICSA